MSILMISYVIEIVMLLIWWKNIVTKEVKYNNIIKKVIKIANTNKKILVPIILNQFDYEDKDMVVFRNEVNSLKVNCLVLLGCALYIIFVPIMLGAVLPNTSSILKIVFSLILIICINIKMYKNYTQSIILILKKILEILNFMNNNSDFLIAHSKSVENIKTKFAQVRIVDIIKLAFCIIFIYIIGFYICPKIEPYILKGTEVFNQLDFRIRLFIILAIILFYWCKGRIQKRRLAQIEIGINLESIELERYRDSIESFCEKVKVKNIIVRTEEGDEINAYAITRQGNTPIIIFSSGIMQYLESLYYDKGEETMDNIFQLIFCHELIHIAKKDNEKINKRAVYVGLVNMVLFILLALLFVSIPSNMIRNVLYILLSCEVVFVLLIVSRGQFWGQISELRADKLSVKITGIDPQIFKLFFESQNKLEKEKEITNRINNENIYYRYYKREVEVEYHPSIERRLQVLVNKRPWGIIYYIEHAITICRWRMSGKGWNGR